MRTMIERENNTNPCGLGKAGEQILDARRPRVGAPCSRRLRGEAQLGSFSGSGSAAARIAAHHRATRQVLCVPGRPAGWGLGSTAATESRADISSPGFLLLAFSNLLQKSPTNV
jgi:hypothetical protein